MALATVFSAKRSDFATVTGTAPSRGLILNGLQTEEQVVSKLTGDVSGSITLVSIQRPSYVYALVLKDNAGADSVSLSLVAVTFTHTSNSVIALSGLGNWTRALLFISGRAYA